jgi:hypothetical protein
VHIRPKGKYAFTAYIITDSASLGDVNGVYHFYESRHFDEFRSALITLSEEVAEASRAIPGFSFFRTLEFASGDKAKEYICEYANIHDRENWLFNSLNWDWRAHGVWVREQFENGAWTNNVTEEHDRFHLLSNTINSLYE